MIAMIPFNDLTCSNRPSTASRLLNIFNISDFSSPSKQAVEYIARRL